MMTILSKADSWCSGHSMLSRGDKILCALSGGADSVALLRLLLALAQKYDLTVEAAHFNHCLRGEESERDERFVKKLCAELGVPLETGRCDVADMALRMGLGTEEAARQLRYEFLERTADLRSCVKVATAHNCSDNAETVLMNLARGSGARGLCGIPPVRGRLIRPILCLERSEIEAYLRELGQPWVEDSTNKEDIYTRNRVRHNILPQLCGVNPGAVGNILAAAELIRQDEEFLTQLAERFLADFAPGEVSADALARQPFPVASRAVRSMAGISLSGERVMSVLQLVQSGRSGAVLQLGGGLEARLEQGTLRIMSAKRGSFEPTVLKEGENRAGEAAVTVRYEPCLEREGTDRFRFEVKASFWPLEIRARLEGDKLRLAFRGGTKSLKKLFIEEKIPRSLRGSVPVLACGGKAVGVPGIGMDENFRARKGESAYVIIFEEG